jgi:hypothetical protein
MLARSFHVLLFEMLGFGASVICLINIFLDNPKLASNNQSVVE